VMQKGDVVYVPSAPKHDTLQNAGNLLFGLGSLVRF